MPLGVPIHSWQAAASTGSGIGYKGMMLASKVLALTGLDLLTNPELVEEAKEELSRVTGGNGYMSPLPDDVQPPTRT
jgi:aminobenzoyl-glutamate utilization protein B